MTNIENMDTMDSLLQEGNVGLMETEKDKKQ
jgi:hypothetical protein